MSNIDEKASAVLLILLDSEINKKCLELKEKHTEVKLKKVFFSSCLFLLFSFLFQIFFNMFNLNFIYKFVIYEGTAIILTAPLILSLNKGELTK